jgi:hypothetical protein
VYGGEQACSSTGWVLVGVDEKGRTILEAGPLTDSQAGTVIQCLYGRSHRHVLLEAQQIEISQSQRESLHALSASSEFSDFVYHVRHTSNF